MMKSNLLLLLAIIVGLPAILLVPVIMFIENYNRILELVGLISSGTCFSLLICSIIQSKREVGS